MQNEKNPLIESVRISPNMCKVLMDHGAQTELAMMVDDLVAIIILDLREFQENLEV